VANGGLGIDLGADGVTANDGSKDSGSGPQQMHNFHQLAVATIGGSRRIVGTLRAAPSTDYVLEFFAAREADPSGFGEAEHFVTSPSTPVTTNASGVAFFDVPLPVVFPPAEWEVAGTFLTATAT